MRYNKPRKQVSGLLACAVICGTAAMPQASVYGTEGTAISQIEEAAAQVTTGAALEIVEPELKDQSVALEKAMSDENFLNADELEAGDITSAAEFGKFTITATSEAKVVVDANSKTAEDGTSFTKRIKLGGEGSLDKRSIVFTANGKAELTVYCISSSSSADRVLNLCDLDGNVVSTCEIKGGGSLLTQTFEIAEAGDYYLASASGGINIYGLKLKEEEAAGREMTLDANELADATITDTKEYGEFKIVGVDGGAVTIAESSQTAEDGTSFSKTIKLGGSGTAAKRSIHFSTTDKATIEVYAMSGSNSADRELGFYSLDGEEIGVAQALGESLVKTTFKVEQAGDYYFASKGSGINVYLIKVSEGEEKPEVVRPSWDSVAAPVITKIDYKEGSKDTIAVEFELETSLEGADKATVEIKDEADTVVESILVGKSNSLTKTLEYKPSQSGTYTFTVQAQRNDEETTINSSSKDFTFKLPLSATEISASNKGGGDVLVKWIAVKEAESYLVEYKKADEENAEYTVGTTVSAEAEELKAMLEGLEVDTAYTLRVSAVRGEERTPSAELNFKVQDRIEREWAYTYFGQSSSSSLNTMEVLDQENLTLKLNSCTTKADGSIDKKGGKLTTFHDGITYYYTEIDPEKENFELTATFTVDYINTTPDGQEGFGIIAMDSLGEHGVNGVNHYTNSAAVLATKFSDSNNVAYKDVLGSRFVSGITPDVLNSGDSAIAQNGKSVSTLMSTDLIKAGESYTLTLKKTNTGYHAIINNDETNEQIMYNGDKLLQLDSEKVYVGFAVARGCNATVSDISMTVTDPSTDPEGIPEPEEFDSLTTKIDSPKFTGSSNYRFVFNANVEGKLTVKDSNGNVLVDGADVARGTDYTKELTLTAGKNDYEVTFTPVEDSRTANGLRIDSYEPVTVNHSVTLQSFEGSEIYVTPEGTAAGQGTEESPTDIYTATKFVTAGQTIVLADGTYDMGSPLNIARGIDGTQEAPITLKSEDGGRAILNFKNTTGGMQLWGSYWHVTGIDVCETIGNIKGFQVAGHNNIIELVNTYRNGDTGLQISGTSAEGMDKWPSNNLILNCTSYDNCDPGMNNADGFAAKITCGEGNVFRGCAAYNNLDDGWDLFAKIESGPIGAVTIEDCIAFANGTLTNGIGDGDGNGFKLGGDGIAVAHVLRNSISFNNNANGITSNSDPAVILENNTAYGNKGTNISLYGKGNGDRLFKAENNISMAGNGADNYSEMPSLLTENNYFYDGSKCMNSAGKELKDDVFENVDVANYIMTRHADGSIDMGDLLKLNSKAPVGIGAVLNGEIAVPSTERSWHLAKDNFAEKTLEGNVETIDDIIIDATTGKFNTAGRSNAQINPGTILKIPVSGPTEITFKHGYDSGTMTFKDEAGNVLTHAYNASAWSTETVVMDKATAGYITIEWEEGSKFYIETLTVKEAQTQARTIEVGPNRTYTTVNDALASIDYMPTEETRVTLALDPGVYVEDVTVTKPYVTFQNADPSKGEVKITYDKASGHDSDINKNFGTQQSASVTIAASATGFEAYDIIFENSYNLDQPNLGDDPNARKQTQAVAVVTMADRIIFDNCKFIGRQDTLYLKGASTGQNSPNVNEARVYLKDCYIEGTVDFIFGDAAAVFENCQLHMAYYTNGGHYTAANTNLATLGYVFNNCELTIDEAYAPYIDAATGQFKVDEKTGKLVKNIDLGRPWQADHTYAYFGSQTVFNNCKMDPAIKAEGWSSWDANTVTNKVRYMEYNSMDLNGNALDLSNRLDWVRILDADQAAAYSTANVLRGSDNWNPSGAELGGVEVADITLDQYKVELPQGESVTLNAKVLPAEAANQTFTWTTSDAKVATVDAAGKVTAVGAGSVIITATTAENNCQVSAIINVLPARTKVPVVKTIAIEAPETILPGITLTGTYSYELEADNTSDIAKVQWFVVDPVTGDEILVQEGTEAFDRTYKVTSGDIGYQIRFAVIPETKTTYGDTGEVVKSEATGVVAKPDYAVPELYVREPFTGFLNKYEQVGDFTQSSDKEWLGANVAKGGVVDRTGLTLLQSGVKEDSGKMAWKVVDTSGKVQGAEDYNGNATIASNIEYQNDASILIYNAKETWTNYTANARVRFSPLATGFSAASYWDMYICYNPATNSGYKVRLSRGGNTSSAVFALYKVENGVETVLAADDTTLANGLKQNSAEENPFFRVEMSNNFGEITAQLYFEGTDEKAVTLTYTDAAPLSGTVAFETFGKTGCPLVDMLTVEEIIKETEGDNGTGNDEPSMPGSGNGSSSYKPSKVTSAINSALAASKIPTIEMNGSQSVTLTKDNVQALLNKTSDLRIHVSDTLEMIVKANTLKEQASKQILLSVPAADKKLMAKIEEVIKADEKAERVNITPVTLSVTANTDKVTSFNEPVQMEWTLSKDQVTEAAKLTAVRYEVQADGSIRAVKIGGSYDAETGKFTFLTDHTGTFGLVEADDLTKLTLTVGSKTVMVNGNKANNDVTPEVVNGRTMLPVRFIAERLGAKVGYSFGRVTITLGEQIISFKVGEMLEGYDIGAYIKEDRTYISARWVAEQLGANVLWVPSTQNIEIIK